MSRYKQPPTLENLAINSLGDWVACQAELQMKPFLALSHRDPGAAYEALSKTVDRLRSILEYNVPWMLHDVLAKEAIRALSELMENIKKSFGFRSAMEKFASKMNMVVKMAEVIFTKYLTFLSIDRIPIKLRSVFYTKLHLLTGLVYLNLGSLSGGWKTADLEGSIIQSLKELHCLKYLVINYDCTDNILKCVVDNCKLMEKLDLSSSGSITNSSIDIIVKLKLLKSVQLYRTLVSLEGFANLLLNCHNLEDIGRCDNIGKVLEYIQSYIDPSKTFKLRMYVSRYASGSHLQLAVQMCPEIKSMTVYHNTLQSDLMVLIGLKDLRELKLLSCDFYADQIKQVLQVKGCNISNLHLEHVDQIDLNALMYISQMCPLLETLTLYNCTLIQHTSLYTKKLDILPFRNLKRITCVATCTEEHLLFILTNCLNIEFIHIGTAIQFTDDFVLKILNINPLLYLKELRIMQSDYLTMTSVDRIIHSCINLEILVELESWTLLTESDREYVRNYIKINNFNIDTAPIRRYDI
ncbi:uncharacterized protein LOC135088329 [Ostrinia nubilalis]|uniref:uncharacterized protein LOC114355113 n=1 Tax=Ostrinia furnacalis TaxID=93504 RepID=UPI00103CF0FC|nr:uncharacterized protein LOC114355113 [Ostrinia furnacalis]